MLTLGTLLKLIDLLDDERLDLLLHDRGLRLDFLLCLSGLALDNARVLSSQLSDQLLQLAFLLSLEGEVLLESLDTCLEEVDVNLAHLALNIVGILTSILLVPFLTHEFTAVEHIPGVVNHDLILRLALFLDDLINSLAQILAAQHDILNVLQGERQQGNRVHGFCTVCDLVEGQTVDLVHDGATIGERLDLDVLVLELEEHFDLAVDEDIDLVVILVLLEDLVA